MALDARMAPALEPRRSEPMPAAYLALLSFIVVYFARPTDWLSALNVLPLGKVTGIVAVATLAVSVLSGRAPLNRLPREAFYLVLLFAQLALTVPFSPVWRGGAFKVVFLEFSKVVVMTIGIMLIAKTLKRLTMLLFVQAGAVATVSVVSLLRSRLVAERLTGILNGIYGNPNDLALAVALAFPMCFAFLLRTRSLLRKIVWSFTMITMVGVVLLTFSRAGLLALLVAGGVCLWEFGVKGRRQYLVVGAAGAGLGVLILAGSANYAKRIETIFKPSEDPTGSAQAREYLLKTSIRVSLEHPLFGVGPGNFGIVSGNWHETHNTYTQLSSEAGIAALILFLLIMRRGFINIREAKRLVRGKPEEQLFATALGASFASFAVGSVFASAAYQFFPYFLVGYTSALRAIAGTEATAPSELSQPPQEAGFRGTAYRSQVPKVTLGAY